MSNLLPAIATLLRTHDPREYVDYEGVLIPVDGPSVAIQLVALAFVLAFILFVVVLDRKKTFTSGRRRWRGH